MRRRLIRHFGGTTVAVVVLLAVGSVHGQTMKMVGTEIPLPTDDALQSLKGLKYGHPWTVEFTSIRVEHDPAKNVAMWTISGSSGRARPERVQIVVKLMNASGKDIAAVKKSTVVKTGGDEHDYVLKMKIKPGVWEAARSVKIFVNFFIAS